MLSDLSDPHPDAPNNAADPPQLPDAALSVGDLTVREAVRRAVVDLGPDADIHEVLAHLQAKFGLSPPRGTVQTYLCLARRDAREGIPGEPRQRARPRKATPNGQPYAPPTLAVEEVIEAVEILRDLCGRLGDDNLRRLLDAL